MCSGCGRCGESKRNSKGPPLIRLSDNSANPPGGIPLACNSIDEHAPIADESSPADLQGHS